jgi:hypothetical protein
VVEARRLRAPARDDRSGLRVVGLPGRHRPRERLEPHRRPRARLRARTPLQRGDRAPRHARGPASADPEDGVPPEDRGPDEEPRRVQRVLAPVPLLERGRGGRVLGVPGSSRSWAPTPRRCSRRRSRGTRGGSRSARSPTRPCATRPAG